MEDWHTATTQEKRTALSKDWYIRWSYRNPKTGKLEKQPHIKSGLNRLKTASKRFEFMNTYKKAMIETFNEGINPFSTQEKTPEIKGITIKDALTTALSNKKNTVSARTFKDYKSELTRFLEYLKEQKKISAPVHHINRVDISEYLNTVLQRTSARTRNNTRSALSALFSDMAENFVIDRNFIDTDIKKIATKSKLDRRFSTDQLRTISNYLQKEDPNLLLYIKIVAYNFLRPIEVNRLQVKSVDLKERLLYFDQKTKKGKTKYIPDIYFNEIKALCEGQPGDYFLFTPYGKPYTWEAQPNYRRDYFTKRFKKLVKDKFNLGEGYGIYSFRHTYITGAYVILRKEKQIGHTEAIEFLMRITGHHSTAGIEKYIHETDADLPTDWSDLIKFKL